MIWIGSKRGTKEKLNVSNNLQWGDSQFNLLGIIFSCNLYEMPDLNYGQALKQDKYTLKSWEFRCLSPIGKITVIKSLILSKFTHLFTTLPITDGILNNLNRLLFNFIWDGKPDKINRDQMCGTYLSGGLKMTYIFSFEKSVKIKWLKAGILEKDKDWLSLFMQEVDVSKISSVGSEYCEFILYKLNPFWKVVFTLFNILHSKLVKIYCLVVYGIIDKLELKKYFVDWFKLGVRIVGDIVNSECKIMTLEQIKTKYKFSLNILNYYSVKKLVEKFITQTEYNYPLSIDRPYVPFHRTFSWK